MTIHAQIVVRIIKEQELIIGPVAWAEARKVNKLNIIDEKSGEVDFNNSDPKSIINQLVGRYESIFGRASHEVCKEAAAPLIAELPVSEVPSSLQ